MVETKFDLQVVADSSIQLSGNTSVIAGKTYTYSVSYTNALSNSELVVTDGYNILLDKIVSDSGKFTFPYSFVGQDGVTSITFKAVLKDSAGNVLANDSLEITIKPYKYAPPSASLIGIAFDNKENFMTPPASGNVVRKLSGEQKTSLYVKLQITNPNDRAITVTCSGSVKIKTGDSYTITSMIPSFVGNSSISITGNGEVDPIVYVGDFGVGDYEVEIDINWSHY